MVKGGFPKELLYQPIEDRINYIENKTISHPILINAYTDLMDKIDVAGKGNVLLVYGPSGIGKSTLLRKIENEILKKYKVEMEMDKGFIPIFGVEAFNPEDSKFDWIDFYYESLLQVEEILIEEKRLPQSEFDNSINYKQKTKRVLRKSLENVIKYRKVKVLLIDEGQHITKVGSSKSLRNQMDTLKSLASKFNIPIILFGTYELLNFRDLSGQLIRRGMDVHFSRYKADNQSDIQAFKNILWNFQKQLPLHEEPDLLSKWEYFYQRTIGCCGTLRDWLCNTYKDKLKKNPEIKTLHIEDFNKFAPTIDQAYQMAEEITKGEKKYETVKHKEHQLNALLKLNDPIEELEETEEVEVIKEKGKKKSNNKPGQRNSKRDKTGMEYIDSSAQ